MHKDPDYSAAYVILKTERRPRGARPDVHHRPRQRALRRGDRGDAAPRGWQAARRHHRDFAGFWRSLASESQLRWLGPEKGSIHLALAAIVNAVWDLYAKAERKPLWKLLADMTPAQIVSTIDFRYITDALTPDEALDILERQAATKADREAQLLKLGYPAYTTSAGWMGYSEDGIRRLVRQALAEGWTHFKVKVGGVPEDDERRVGAGARGDRSRPHADDRREPELGRRTRRSRASTSWRSSSSWWIEEPTSPDDVLGHAAIAKAVRPAGVGVATGEHCANRIIFKQLLQARGDRLLPDRQLPARRRQREPGGDPDGREIRRAGLPARRRRRPVRVRAAPVDVRLPGGHGHDGGPRHRVRRSPARALRGAGRHPQCALHAAGPPGYSITIKPESRMQHRFPDGPVWASAVIG